MTEDDDRADGADHRWQRRDRQGNRGGIGRRGRDGRVHLTATRTKRRRRPRRDPRPQWQHGGRRDVARPRQLRLGARLREPVSRASRPARRAREQCRPGARLAPRDRRRLRDDVPGQPPRTLPPHPAAARPAGRGRRRTRRERRVRRALERRGAGSTSTTCSRPVATGASASTARPSSPTSCSPASWPDGGTTPASRRTRCTRGSSPAASAATATPVGSAPWCSRLLKPFALSPEQGAQTQVYVASAAELAGITGGYWVKSAPATPSAAAQDDAAAARLWEVSEAARRLIRCSGTRTRARP